MGAVLAAVVSMVDGAVVEGEVVFDGDVSVVLGDVEGEVDGEVAAG